MITFKPLFKNKIIMTAMIIHGLALFCLNYYVIKENRIATGQGVSLYSVSFLPFILIIIAYLVIFGLLYLKQPPLKWISIGIIANFILIILLISLIKGSALLSQNQAGFTRIAPGSGFWLSILSLVLILHTCHQQKKNLPYGWSIDLLIYLACFIFILLLSLGYFSDISIMQEYNNKKNRFWLEMGNHLLITFVSVVSGTIIGVPCGIIAYKKKILEKGIFTFLNLVQTIPSLALFGLLIVPLAFFSQKYPLLRQFGVAGIGKAPAIIAITLYALLPIVQNTYVGLKMISPDLLDAGIGMGMNRFQLLKKIQIPIALPIVLTGIQTSTIQAIGNCAVVALIGAGGLGTFIFQGLGQAAFDLILLGVFPIIFLSIIIDLLIKILITMLSPKVQI